MSQWSANARRMPPPSRHPTISTMRRRTCPRPIDDGPGTRDSFSRRSTPQGITYPRSSVLCELGCRQGIMNLTERSAAKASSISTSRPHCLSPPGDGRGQTPAMTASPSVDTPRFALHIAPRPRHSPRSRSGTKPPSSSAARVVIRHSPYLDPCHEHPSARFSPSPAVVGWFTTWSSPGPFSC